MQSVMAESFNNVLESNGMGGKIGQGMGDVNLRKTFNITGGGINGQQYATISGDKMNQSMIIASDLLKTNSIKKQNLNDSVVITAANNSLKKEHY